MHATSNSAGGWLYHARAWARAKNEWRPYVDWVGERLESWRHGRRSALVFGPSAGYSIPSRWWAGFERVICVEPDPLARRLLRARVPTGVRLEFAEAAGALARLANDGDASELRAALSREPEAAVLFANVLGQLPFLAGVARDPSPLWAPRLLEALSGRGWASFHDALSVRAPRAPLSASKIVYLRGAVDWTDFLAREWPGDKLIAADHGTLALSCGRSSEARWWSLARRRWHLVAWHSSQAAR